MPVFLQVHMHACVLTLRQACVTWAACDQPLRSTHTHTPAHTHSACATPDKTTANAHACAAQKPSTLHRTCTGVVDLCKKPFARLPHIRAGTSIQRASCFLYQPCLGSLMAPL